MDAARLSGSGALLLGLLALLVTASVSPAGESAVPRPSPRETAARVDAAFQRPLPAPVDDETFLRRVSIDLAGQVPGPEEIQRWNADTAAGKRGRLIDRLLHSEAYAVNWGRYWRDVVTYHTPSSANYLRWKLFNEWWTNQFRRNRPWDQVVTALITASGINDEIASVNYLTALYGNPVEIAATTSRVFLGVQIQCAQCHNAKTEPWKREQFHEFAAFFGRARLVQHKDVDGRGTPYAIESRADGQYGMSDKKDPGRLIAMQPRFLTGESVSIDATDEERRQALARFITSPKNPWFARCYVNRMWSCLLGWGFYPAVADLGGHVKPHYPEVLEILAQDWIASGYDVRWLFETITCTRAYQGRMQAPGSAPSMPAACPVRLRPEQVFEAMQKALGFDENDKTIPAPAPSSSPAVQRHKGLRNMVYQMFKVDPSLPQAEVQGTIPQALVMMNSALVHATTSARGKTMLAELLAAKKSDDEIITTLYERVLARKPTAAEKAICLRHIGKVEKREEALEDVLWSLVNSTEFLLKK
jgi:hypothetical protein